MQVQQHIPLAPMTSFGVGGPAEKLVTVTDSAETEQILMEAENGQLWLIGHGTNVLISDEGLPDTTIRFASGRIVRDGTILIADAGASWDDLVQTAIDQNLWGLELTSGVPGSVGAAIYINITAYGQSNNDHLIWIRAIDKQQRRIIKLNAAELDWGYKQSIFQEDDRYIVIQAAYELSETPTQELTYQSALDIAAELNIEPDGLQNRRQIILETRKRAGSLFRYGTDDAKTVGSFFRNPIVTQQQAKLVTMHDESGKTQQQIKKMNREHGGDNLRVSAAHVMLAAGFKRGQTFGPVRLHPDHVLKIENTGGATAQHIYEVAQKIINTCQDKIGITLEPEASMLGRF